MSIELLKSACYFIAVLSVLVIVHEWGHFFVAKLCKMRVDDFSLFFGPRLIRVGKRNGTEYNIRCVPLGGFVKIAGMEPEEEPVYSAVFPNNPDTGKSFKKTMRGLAQDALVDVNFANVSPQVLESVDRAIDRDGLLTPEGKEEIRTLLLTTGLTQDEHRYLEALLIADTEAQKVPDPEGYNQKPIWQRAAVIFAGPFMSLFFGYLLFCVMGFTTGMPVDHIAVGKLEAGKPAELAGLKPGDLITQINGKERTAEETLDIIHESANKPLQVTVVRGKAEQTFNITPYNSPVETGDPAKPPTKMIGRLGFVPDQVWARSPGVLEAIQRGNNLIYGQVVGIVKTIFSPRIKENVGGIITISRVINEDSKQGPERVLFTAALLSVSLGVLNLFPIPVLDGGHLMLLTWEGLRRRRLTTREMASAQVFGLCVIGILFVLVMYNDIMRLPIFSHH